AVRPERIMASLTVRKLDDAVKARLRARAAGSGRSVEEEIRVILREATAIPSGPSSDGPASRNATSSPDGYFHNISSQLPKVTMIVGGGIAAYKALDLIRRLRERGFFVRCVMTNAAQQF